MTDAPEDTVADEPEAADEPAAEVEPEAADEPAPEVDDTDTPDGPAHAIAVLTYVVQQVVDNPDAVSVSAGPGRRGTTQLDVRVGDGDMGRVIGKRGRIAQSIRTVVRAAAVKDDTPVDIEFVD